MSREILIPFSSEPLSYFGSFRDFCTYASEPGEPEHNKLELLVKDRSAPTATRLALELEIPFGVIFDEERTAVVLLEFWSNPAAIGKLASLLTAHKFKRREIDADALRRRPRFYSPHADKISSAPA